MRLAVISDVHGNRFALEAVLDDIFSREKPEAVLNLGDHLSGPVDPLGTAEILAALDQMAIAGNHERAVLAPDRATERVDSYVADQLGEAHLDWVRRLPATAVYEEQVFLCHGTPQSDEMPWLNAWWSKRNTTLPDEAYVTQQAQGYDFPLLLCGHTHLARAVRLRDGRMIVNPGSVGLQTVHGSPDARYAIVEKRNGCWSASLKTVPYNHAAAADAAARNGFAHWDEVLRTGWGGPEGLF